MKLPAKPRIAWTAIKHPLRLRIRRFANRSEFVRRIRKRRYERFLDLLDVKPGDRIIDIGAGGGAALARFNATNPITAVDLAPLPTPWLAQDNVTVVVGDAMNLPFADRTFDIAFCNSVIEHVPPEDQPKLASEVRRVAERYFVQTPYRYFPVEPHFHSLFLHFLPKPWRRRLHRYVKIGARNGQWQTVHLLTSSELQRLLPEGEIHHERWLGMTKSLMAVRR